MRRRNKELLMDRSGTNRLASLARMIAIADDVAMRISPGIANYTSMSSWIIVVFLLIGTLGAQTKAPPSKPVPGQGATAFQDKETESLIRTKLAKSKIGKDGFTVRVQGGVAYWDGSTNVVQHKGAATRMAKSSGAKRVVNNIKISDEAKEKAAGNLEQGRRRAQVKRSDPRSQ
jgi:BON domain